MPERKYGAGRYGFNGKERDKDISSDAYDYGMRISDQRLGRFLSVDPLQEDYPELTPYQFASNSPIVNIDLDGLERYWYVLENNSKNGTTQLKHHATEERAPTMGDAFASLFGRSSENFNGPKYEKAIYVRIETDGVVTNSISFKYFKELYAWKAAGYPNDQVAFQQALAENNKTAAQATLQLQMMTLQSMVDNADGDIDGYTQPGSYVKSKSTATTTSTNNQATAANGGNTQAAKSNAITKPSTLRPGPYAKESVPARSTSTVFTTQERTAINKIGNTNGCHTCGILQPGTKSGNWIPDHQPSSAIKPVGKPQVLLPHCLKCSQSQGGTVSGIKRAMNSAASTVTNAGSILGGLAGQVKEK